jgi:hypothetical protein
MARLTDFHRQQWREGSGRGWRFAGVVPPRTDRWVLAGLGVRVWQRAGRPAWRPRREIARVGARSSTGSAGSISISPFPLRKTPYFCTEVNKVINNKVVDLLILYHLHKGRIASFSTNSAQSGCQDA